MKRKRENDENDLNEKKKRKENDNLSFEDQQENFLKELTERIEKNKDRSLLLSSSYFTRGMTYHMVEGKNNLALDDFNMAIKIDPKKPRYYCCRGKVYFSQEKYDLALQDFCQAIKLDSKHVTSFLERGSLYEKFKQYDLALKDYSQAIKVDPYVSNYNVRGNLYKKLKQNDLALQDYSQAIKVSRNFEEMYISKENTDERLRYTEIVSRMKNVNVFETYVNLSNLYNEMTNYLHSIKYESLAKELMSDSMNFGLYSEDVLGDYGRRVEKLKKRIFMKNISKW